MTSRKLWWASLCKSSPRYEAWRGILASDEVPLKTLQSGVTELGGERVEVYEVDVQSLTALQRERLIRFVEQKFAAPRAEIEHDLDTLGFPIRECDVVVAFDLRLLI